MKKLSTIIVLLGALVMLTGCPLQMNAPIDNGSYTATNWLVGTWIAQKADGSVGKTYLFKKSDKPGWLQVFEVTDGKPETTGRPVVVSSVGNNIFVSAYEEGSDVDEKGYYIFHMIKKSSKAFDVVPVKEYSINREASSLEIRAFLTQHATDDSIYEAKDTEHYTKH